MNQGKVILYAVEKLNMKSIKIKLNHVNKYASNKPTKSKKKEVQMECPKCGEKVAQSEMEDHLRIELLDPRWREKRKVGLERQQARNLLDNGSTFIHPIYLF